MKLKILSVFAGTIAAFLTLASPATAEPLTDTDMQFLRAVQHGGVCCQWQADTPLIRVNPETRDTLIEAGRTIGRRMTEAGGSYQLFTSLRANLDAGVTGLSSFAAGELVVIAVRYYAPLWVEHQLIAQMGEEAGYWYGQEVRTQMVPVR